MIRSELIRSESWKAPFIEQWNSLWSESGCPTASARGGMVELFNQTFAPKAQSVAVTAWRGEKLVGLLPLNVATNRAWIKSAALPVNEWSQCGRMLVGPTSPFDMVVDTLGAGLVELAVASLTMHWTPIDTRAVRRFKAMARHRGWGVQTGGLFDVGLIRLPETFESYLTGLSKNSRKKLRQEQRSIESAGPVELEDCSNVSASLLDDRMEEAFAIEMASWKGPAGSAMACHDSVRAYFAEGARRLHAAGLLGLYFLKLKGERIAFDLGSFAHGVYASQKIGFLESHRQFQPGHVLNALLIQHLISSQQARAIDTVGPMNEANRRWSNDVVRMGRVTLAPGSWIGNPSGRSWTGLLALRSAWKQCAPGGAGSILSGSATSASAD